MIQTVLNAFSAARTHPDVISVLMAGIWQLMGNATNSPPAKNAQMDISMSKACAVSATLAVVHVRALLLINALHASMSLYLLSIQDYSSASVKRDTSMTLDLLSLPAHPALIQNANHAI